MTSATEKHPCDMPIDFYAGECPDYGSMDCPKTVPGAKCGVDVQYARELIQVKNRYYERRAANERPMQTMRTWQAYPLVVRAL